MLLQRAIDSREFVEAYVITLLYIAHRHPIQTNTEAVENAIRQLHDRYRVEPVLQTCYDLQNWTAAALVCKYILKP